MNKIDKILLSSFEHFKAEGSYTDAGNHLFEELTERGIIQFCVERKKRILATATLEARKKVEGSHDVRELSISIAKQMALNEFYSDLLEMDLQLKELI